MGVSVWFQQREKSIELVYIRKLKRKQSTLTNQLATVDVDFDVYVESIATHVRDNKEDFP